MHSFRRCSSGVTTMKMMRRHEHHVDQRRDVISLFIAPGLSPPPMLMRYSLRFAGLGFRLNPALLNVPLPRRI